MSCSSEDETDISESELEDYVDRCYEHIIDGDVRVKLSDEVYRCPYCPGKKKLVYKFKDLLQHASDVAKGSLNRDIKHKGKHLSLVKYLNGYPLQDDLPSDISRLTLELPPGNGVKELFVWPWMGILANVGVSSTSLRNDMIKKGFDQVRVRSLPNDNGKSGYAVVEFKKGWGGFHNAMMFEKEFEFASHAKKDYLAAPHLVGELFGWIARDDDYNSEDILGLHLQKWGDLKTIGDVEAEEKRKNSLLIADLSNTIEQLRMHIDGLENKRVDASEVLDHMGSPNNPNLISFASKDADVGRPNISSIHP